MIMAIIRGTPGDDPDLDGTAEADEIFGLAGNDRLNGLAGNDRLEGNAGVDDLFGGADDDRMFGGDDRDVMVGEAGADFLRGGPGNDQLEVGGFGVADDDDNFLDGGAGDDVLIAQSIDTGNNVMVGGTGNDTFLGGGGQERMFGEADDDTLEGGLGADENRGGDGADRFLFDDSAQNGGEVIYDTGVGAGNRDRIIDFDGAEGDNIHVGNIDADLTVDLDQDFTFVGDGPVGKGEIGFFETTNRTIVRGNTGDDAAADFEIQLNGIGLDLSAESFVL
jgi:serralysin